MSEETPSTSDCGRNNLATVRFGFVHHAPKHSVPLSRQGQLKMPASLLAGTLRQGSPCPGGAPERPSTSFQHASVRHCGL